MPEFNQNRIYLDDSASAPIDPAVAEVLRQYLEGQFGGRGIEFAATANRGDFTRRYRKGCVSRRV
jgi:cysteine sulfinate desulfinase/cysteine desulfurase-like protein